MRRKIGFLLLYMLICIGGVVAGAVYGIKGQVKSYEPFASNAGLNGLYSRKIVDIRMLPDYPDETGYGRNKLWSFYTWNKRKDSSDDVVNYEEMNDRSVCRDLPVVGRYNSNNYDRNMENIIFNIISNYNKDINPRIARRYSKWFVQYSKKYKVNPLLAVAVGLKESGFNHNRYSPAGAFGIMQIMPVTARQVGIVNRTDPEQNIKGGIKYLHNQLYGFKSLRLALAAYNAGPGVIQRHRKILPLPEPYYRETNYYVPHIERFLKKQLVEMGIDPKVMNDINFWLLS